MKKGPFFDTVKSTRIRECIDDISAGRYTNEKKQTLNDIGLELGYAPETISRIKNGHQDASLEFAQLLIDHYCHDIDLEYLTGKSSLKSHKRFDALGEPAHGSSLLAQAAFGILSGYGIEIEVARYYSQDEITLIESMLPDDNKDEIIAAMKEILSSGANIPREFNVTWKNARITINTLDFLNAIKATQDTLIHEFIKLFAKSYIIAPQQRK